MNISNAESGKRVEMNTFPINKHWAYPRTGSLSRIFAVAIGERFTNRFRTAGAFFEARRTHPQSHVPCHLCSDREAASQPFSG
jgi:hypothetical protein